MRYALDFCRRAINHALYLFLNKFFWNDPRLGLKLFYFFKIDLLCYTLPWFIYINFKQIRRLRALRKQGLNPAIVFCTVEGDGRFDRLFKMGLAPENKDSVWFKFPAQLVAVDALYFKAMHNMHLSRYDDVPLYYMQPENLPHRLRYREYCHRLYELLEKVTGKIDFILNASNHDRQIIELIQVAQSRGIRWVVCERESVYTKFTKINEAKANERTHLLCADYIFTANTKHHYVNSFAKQPSVRSVEVLGELDVDFFFHYDRKFSRKEYAAWHPFRKKVLFLTFGTRNYIEPYAIPNRPDLNWKTLLAQSEEEIYQFAKANPDILVFYKMGHHEDLNLKFIARFQAEGLQNIVPLTRAFPCSELILYCDLTIGFQTTAMYEAMFHDKPLWYLYWAIPEDLNVDTHLLPLAYSKACTTVDSPKMFASLLARFAQNDPTITTISKEERDQRKVELEDVFYKADGKTAERYWERLNQLFLEKRLQDLEASSPRKPSSRRPTVREPYVAQEAPTPLVL